MGVVRPCPSVRNDIVIPKSLVFFVRYSEKGQLKAAIKRIKYQPARNHGTMTGQAMLKALESFRKQQREDDTVARVNHHTGSYT